MRICCVGAGALGGYVAGKLAQADVEVVAVDQGEHQQAMSEQGGLLLLEPGREPEHVSLDVAGLGELGPQDVVVLGVKAMNIEDVAPLLGPLFHSSTRVVTVQNGLPWWYFQRHPGSHEGYRLRSLDPDGVIGRHIDPERILACVAYPAADRPEPGKVRLVAPGRFPLGELDGSESGSVRALFEVFEGAGLPSRILDDVRSEIWLKAWGSLSFNPISALTGATLQEICENPHTRALAARLMTEAEQVALALGVTFRRTIEERIAGAEKVGHHKTSMLQDVEAGRRLEVAALISVVRELGELTGVPTPTIDAVDALVRLLDERIAAGHTGAELPSLPLS